MPPKAILPINEVQHRTGLSRPTIYRHMSQNRFPRSVRRGASNTGWLEHEIDDYVESCIALSRTDATNKLDGT
ncbi:MAG: helix-turn-helix transcriptional regulator [Oceanococcus sp.]